MAGVKLSLDTLSRAALVNCGAGRCATAASPDLGALMTVRATSGLPYMRLENEGIGVIAPDVAGGSPVEPFRASRLPLTKTLGHILRIVLRAWQFYGPTRTLRFGVEARF